MPNTKPFIPNQSNGAEDNFFECATMQMSPAQLFAGSARPGGSILSVPKAPPPLPTGGRKTPKLPAIGTEYELSLVRTHDEATTNPGSPASSLSGPAAAGTVSGESYAPESNEERTMEVRASEVDITDTTSTAADSTLASHRQLVPPPSPSSAGHGRNKLRTWLQFAMLILVVEALVGLTIHLYVTLAPAFQEPHLAAPQTPLASPAVEKPAPLMSSPVSMAPMK